MKISSRELLSRLLPKIVSKRSCLNSMSRYLVLFVLVFSVPASAKLNSVNQFSTAGIEFSNKKLAFNKELEGLQVNSGYQNEDEEISKIKIFHSDWYVKPHFGNHVIAQVKVIHKHGASAGDKKLINKSGGAFSQDRKELAGDRTNFGFDDSGIPNHGIDRGLVDDGIYNYGGRNQGAIRDSSYISSSTFYTLE